MLELLKEQYDILRKIGQGGMAQIYFARDKFTNQEVAIKILSPDKKNSEVDKKRFLREIKLTQKIETPYVVKIIGFKWEDKIQYIVMEHIEGEILKEYIARRTKLTVDEVVEFSKQLALGFEEIHRVGIVHRDIKSSNVIISNYGQVKIIDFGIAINNESERLTKTNNVIGSIQYIAPEILEQENITKQSDIYALGILMFEMLVGDVPYKEKNLYKIAMKHKKSTIPHVNKIFDNIPQSISNCIIKATAKDLTKRYSTMYDLYKDVSSSLDNSRIYEPLLNLDEKEKFSFKKFINSKTVLIGIITTILIILITLIVAFSLKVL